MDLYEFEAVQLFQDFGLTVPPRALITKPEELRRVHLGYPLVLKCQVLTGGRGKAGGIKFADNLRAGEELATSLLELVIRGSKTRSLLIQPKVQIKKELYLSVTISREAGCPIFVGSTDGGVDIESSKNTVTVPISFPYCPYIGRTLAQKLGFSGSMLMKVAACANNLYHLFEQRDLDLAEINPLVVTAGDDLVALDGKVTVNDDALSRQESFAGWMERHLLDLSDRERRSRINGLNLVELDGDIGIVSNGAGLTMATMDLVKAAGGSPGNFLDAGGGSDQQKTLLALELVHENPALKVILVNILAGITNCDDVAKALLTFRSRHPERKLVVRLRGNNQETAETKLATSGITLHGDLDDAVAQAVNLTKIKQEETKK